MQFSLVFISMLVAAVAAHEITFICDTGDRGFCCRSTTSDDCLEAVKRGDADNRHWKCDDESKNPAPKCCNDVQYTPFSPEESSEIELQSSEQGKRVRFSNPGPAVDSDSASSGLTPFIRRTSLSTPTSNRRHSTPAALRISNRAHYDAPISGTLQFESLRQVLDGRVKRRLRRNRLSEEINIIEWDKRHETKQRKNEVERLRQELAAKDLEVQSMRDEQDIASQIEGESGMSVYTSTTQSTKIQELEQVIVDLRAELQRKEDSSAEEHDWTIAARDPFDFDDDDDNMITNYDDDDFMESDDLITTPTRLNTSFPSPPSTVPNTPCRSASSTSLGIQACLPIPDPEKDMLRTQLEALQTEVSKLSSAIAFKDDHNTRLTEKLTDFLPVDESHDHSSLDSALDSVLTELALSQSNALEQHHAFSALKNEIGILGFSSSGPEEALEIIGRQFRQARLDLEYLTPGEVVEGFENHKLLEMLVSRIKVLIEKVNERDDTIDEYHEQELSLRQQLNTRVSVADALHKELYLANTVVGDLREEIEEKEVSNERLQSALEGYREEVRGLELLIGRMETEAQITQTRLRNEVADVQNHLQDEVLKHDTTRASDEGKDMMVMELERRLTSALTAASEMQQQLAALNSSRDASIAEKDSIIQQLRDQGTEMKKEHGEGIATRDSRLTELQSEVERINEALKSAHSTILALQLENQGLRAQVQGEKTRGLLVVQAMRDQLTRVLDTGMGYINGDVSVQGPFQEENSHTVETSNHDQSVVRRGRFLDADLARKGGKKRRKYDSGLGFLEEESEGETHMNIETQA
ncbi:hypothetical protein G7Y89_g2386 [Cudoniella acicularis]|uniref:Uncharacterized protein n=1 Tax=Cudoniella acicularis TaxID=354080 RepID=A0A8H4RV96_9HELO|nr:hypothetical protein G7Y89_g2386 [Cudoniella acicularis]